MKKEQMANIKIPLDVQEKANSIIADFNLKTYAKDSGVAYYAVYRGAFLYLNRIEGDIDGPIARLKYNGEFTNWDFAIYKWSRESYDPNEDFFPGFECNDGTIEGALKAGNMAYPPRWTPPKSGFGSFFKQIFGKL